MMKALGSARPVFTPPHSGHIGNFIVTAVLGLAANSGAQGTASVGFTDIMADLPGVQYGALAWGDYDNDGDLDLVLVGHDGLDSVSRVYRNDAGIFTDIIAGLPGMAFGSAAWGDYDNDGDLDLVLAGRANPVPISRVYRNDAGNFVDVAAELPGVDFGSAAWGDYDNDGDLDLVLAGSANPGAVSRVYRNDAGIFVDVAAGLPGVVAGTAAWGDYDNDGDLDLVMTGQGSGGYLSRVYRNDAGNFVDVAAGLPGVVFGSAAWGDYDNDGDLDLVLVGFADSDAVFGVYRNDAGTFTNIAGAMPGTGFRVSAGGRHDIERALPLVGHPFCRAAWGDFDNDGDLDLALAGYVDSQPVSRVYRNDSGSFIDIVAALPWVVAGTVAWGDYDNDGDLDLVLAGGSASGPLTRVYRNAGAPPNTQPSAPGGLTGSFAGDQVILSWIAATDAETPAAGLSYNLRIGTTPGGNEISSAMSDGDNGFRCVAALGNAQQGTKWTVAAAPTDCYWSVQAIDGAWAGSPFADEQVLSSQTAVYLLQFLAERRGPQAMVHWAISQPRAQTEFQVWREGAGSGRVRLSEALASGQVTYDFVDRLPPAEAADYWLQEVSPNGLDSWYGPAHLEAVPIPTVLRLGQNQPNPFNPATTFSFSLPKSGRVTLAIHDVRGSLVATLVEANLSAGEQSAEWDGVNGRGLAVPSGVYFARLETPVGTRTVKVTLAR